MSYARKMTRPDATQTEIVDGLRKAGVQVWIIGQPCDLLTLYRGRWQPLECKPVKERNRKDQERQSEFLASTGVKIVRTALEAIAAVTLRTEPTITYTAANTAACSNCGKKIPFSIARWGMREIGDVCKCVVHVTMTTSP